MAEVIKVFRVQHKQSACTDSRYRNSPGTHGPFSADCDTTPPAFGSRGECPGIAPIAHQRCGVTAEQFEDWTYGDLTIFTDWEIVCHEMEADDCRVDNNQIVFDPVWALSSYPVSLAEVMESCGVPAYV